VDPVNAVGGDGHVSGGDVVVEVKPGGGSSLITRLDPDHGVQEVCDDIHKSNSIKGLCSTLKVEGEVTDSGLEHNLIGKTGGVRRVVHLVEEKV
jgi:hypothetical protein